MKKLFIITTAVIAAATVLLALGMFSDDSSASYSSTFGSDSVGAERIVFDSNGGSGGYVQYVLNGNSVYFPTEYKAPGTSNITYQQIGRDGYVLTGWSEDRDAVSPTYLPGQPYTVTVPKTFYAVWKACSGTYDRFTVPLNQISDIDVHNGNNQSTVTLVENVISVSGGMGVTTTITYSISCNGQNPSENSGIGTVTNGGITVSLQKGSFTVSCNPDVLGWYEIHLHYYSHSSYGGGSTTERDAYWYIVTYDPGADASDIMHAAYDGNDCGYGPYHTAVKLPDSVSVRQKGWNVIVDGSPAVFPVGGSYTLAKKETTLTVNEYTFEELEASGVAGVLAYNANGGTYNGAFADLVATDGFSALKSGSLVTKEGHTFLGWNPTGLSSDAIYSPGYLYGIEGEYTELKAVWGTSGTPVTLYFVNPGDGTQNFSFVTYSGHRYALPENGIALSGYDFIGWSETNNEVGMGSAELGSSVTVTSTKTYYAVFQPKVYECTIHYDANGGTGTMGVQSETVSTVPHYMTVAGCAFAYPGYSFAGWSENRYADSPSYSAGSSYCFTDSGEITLYAVWAETPVPEYNTFYTVFNGNGPSVTNLPPQTYRNTPEREIAVYVPSSVPAREGFRFVGWATTEYGAAEYSPGEKIVLTMAEGQHSMTLVLFAVWEAKTEGGDGTEVTVTFVGDSGILRSVKVPSGSCVTRISAPSVDGRAFLGWYDLSARWDFSAPVTHDLTLTAKYLQVCHLDIEGTSVKVVLDCVSSSTRVQFSDGFTKTYESDPIPEHKVAANTDGTVTVTVTAESGTHTAVCRYAVSDEDLGSSDTEKERKTIDLVDHGYVVIAIVGILGIIVAIRRFY